jgi:hypothetical protein
MSEINEMKCCGSAVLGHKETGRTPPGSASGERRQHSEVAAIHIKMQHTQVTEVHIKLTVKRNTIENIELLYQMRHFQ